MTVALDTPTMGELIDAENDLAAEKAMEDAREETAELLSQRSRQEKLDIIYNDVNAEEDLKDKLIESFKTSTPYSMLNDDWINNGTLDGIINDVIIDNELEL